MNDGKQNSRTRRKFLKAGTLTLTAGIAGCEDLPETGGGTSTPIPNGNPTGVNNGNTGNSQQGELVATFNGQARQFTFNDINTHDTYPSDLSDLSNVRHEMDTTHFGVEIQDANTAIGTIGESSINKPLTLTLHIRDANGDFQTTSEQLQPTSGAAITTHTIEFDLSNITLPRTTGSICQFTATNTNTNNPERVILNNHIFVGIPHSNGTKWINSDNFTKKYIFKTPSPERETQRSGVSGVNVQGTSGMQLPPGHIEYTDRQTERQMFYAVQIPRLGEVFGISFTVPKAPVERFKNGNVLTNNGNAPGDRMKYGVRYEPRFATQINVMQELAQKTHDAITQLGITDPEKKLEALGDFIQMIPYDRDYLQTTTRGSIIPPTLVLHDYRGDCGQKAALFSCIVQNNPWNIMPVYIDCKIGNERHRTIGLDVSDLGSDYDPSNNFTVSPTPQQISDGFRDTEFAFFDMTYNSYIGQNNGNISNESVFDTGDHQYKPLYSADTPPNY